VRIEVDHPLRLAANAHKISINLGVIWHSQPEHQTICFLEAGDSVGVKFGLEQLFRRVKPGPRPGIDSDKSRKPMLEFMLRSVIIKPGRIHKR
jgi:hypothetical protein